MSFPKTLTPRSTSKTLKSELNKAELGTTAPVRCETLQRDALGLVSLPSEDLDRRQAEAHATGCQPCADALGEARTLLVVIDGAGDALPWAPDEAALARVASTLHRVVQASRHSRVYAALAAVIVLATAGVPLAASGALALTPTTSIAMALAFAGASLGALALGGLGALAAVLPLLSAGLAAYAGRSGALQAGVGLHCLAFELATAVPTLAYAVVLVRRGVFERPRSTLAAAAGAGAIAGQAALHVLCEATPSHAHLFGFHLTGVALALGLGALVGASRWVLPAALRA